LPPGIEIVGGRCLAIIQTRQIYLSDFIGLVLGHPDDPQIALQVVGEMMISKELA
jgi:hypothetical protein